MKDRNSRHCRELNVRQIGGSGGVKMGLCERGREREYERGRKPRGREPLRAAVCSESAKGKSNEDRAVVLDNAALVMDGIYGNGQCESVAVTEAAVELWRDHAAWRNLPDQGLCNLAHALEQRKRSTSRATPGAATCAVTWDENGAVDMAALGDVVVFLVEPASASALLEPHRTEDGRLDAYLGRAGLDEQAIRVSSARLSNGPSCIVIATDGVWEHVPATCMVEAWAAAGYDIDAFAHELVRRARVFGSEDDATAVVLG